MLNYTLSQESSFLNHLLYPNTLWAELQKRKKDKIAISTYIKQAIIEKMEREK